MAEEKSATSTGEIKKEQSSTKKETASASKKEIDKSVWEKAAETIAGDNTLMASALKIVLSPITLLGGAGLIVYLFLEMRKQKEQIEKLQQENKGLEDNYKEAKEKYKKWKTLAKELEVEKSAAPNIGFVPQKVLPMQNISPVKKTYHSDYLE